MTVKLVDAIPKTRTMDGCQKAVSHTIIYAQAKNKTVAYFKKLPYFLSATLLTYVVLLHATYYVHNRISSVQHKDLAIAHRSMLEQVNVSVSNKDLRGNSTKFQILYLVQTEKCLPSYLKSPEVIGNSTACQCDVLVLNYKEECNDTSLPHVKYIFHPNTTWTTGRNFLYVSAKSRDNFYLYYIFMDDDTQLLVASKSDRNPWRMFEDALKAIQPPIAVVDPWITFSRVSRPKVCEPENVTKFAQIFWFDAMFNAFHTQVIHHILPYPTKFDENSWWYSQIYIMIRSDIKFNGQIVDDTRLKVRNTQHRPYPRRWNKNVFKIVTEAVRNEIPEKYQNRLEPILQQWMKDNIEQRKVPGDFYCSTARNTNTELAYVPYES